MQHNIPGFDHILRQANGRGDVLALCVVGSTAYGLAHQDSDIDLLGVYRAPTAQILQLTGTPEETIHRANEVCPSCLGRSIDVPFAGAYGSSKAACETCLDTGMISDYTLHELGKFCRLAAAANPTILELLFAEPVVYDEQWNLIIENRSAFISTAVRRTYGGYAKAQLQKKELREKQGQKGYSPKTKYRDAKHTRHIVRLFLQQKQILETGEIVLGLSPDEKRLCTEAMEWDSVRLKAWMDEMTLSSLEINGGLPPEPDYGTINKILLELRGF